VYEKEKHLPETPSKEPPQMYQSDLVVDQLENSI